MITSTSGINTLVAKMYQVDVYKLLTVNIKKHYTKSDYLANIFCESK
jgi:hypothetical protein